MATLEEITQQFEDALGESAGTTIQPGTITPQGVTSSVSGKKKLSWPEIVEKINEGVGVRQNELLPEIPEGVSAQKFYRTAAQEGLLPSGLSTFSSSPFGSFQGRIGIAQGAKSVAPTAPVESVDAPQSVVQTQRIQQAVDDGGGYDDPRDYVDPIANPDINLATLGIAIASPGAAFSKMMESENIYTSLVGYDPVQIDAMIDEGRLNEAQVAAYQQGVFTFDSDGFAVGQDGKPLGNTLQDSYAVYHSQERDKFNDSIITKAYNYAANIIPGMDQMSYNSSGFREGYNADGTYTTAGGQTLGGSTYAAFESLIETNLDRALEVIEARGVGGLFGISRDLAAKARAADARRGDNELNKGGEGNDRLGTGPFGPQPGDPDAPGEQDIDGGDDQGSDPGSEDMGTDGWLRDGGAVKMQDGGMAPQGAEADMSNLGMINEQAAQPQQGGAKSVKDDIPREADAGDYILPYETVLLVGLKDLNRYAKEAIDLAMENGVNLKGTDLDPTDDVPIKVSNYEYHIPKMLVPFFGGGKKYLDKIRQEGLDLRTRLEEEKQPSMQEQQPMAEAVPAPAPEQEVAAPQAPMMQQGGFVDDPQKKQMQTSAAVLEADASQQSPSAYNQMQALERTRRQAQQPPMVDPMGRVVQQGFAAPQGYADGTEPGGMRLVKPFEVEQSVLDAAKPPAVDEGMARKKVPVVDETVIEDSEFNFNPNMFKVNQTKSPPSKGPLTDEEFSSLKEDVMRLKDAHVIELMALTGMAEERENGREGIRGAMNVMNNRLNYSKRFGNTIKEIMFKKYQFDAIPNITSKDKVSRAIYDNFKAVINTRQDDELFLNALRDARDILSGQAEDNTNGAVYFSNLSKLKTIPKHLKGREPLVKIGSTSFFAIEPVEKNAGGFVARAA